MLHETPSDQGDEDGGRDVEAKQVEEHAQPFHVLFTSHHLVSSKKRRSLQQWANSLKVSGFAKVGYPGVIYAQGSEESIEEFVSNVKSMQWLALRVRYVEPVPQDLLDGPSPSGWREFSRVGEVVEEMRRLGRESCVLGMGIGSTSSE